MKNISGFAEKIIQKIADDKLGDAIKDMQKLLKGSPLYTEVILHSARYNDIMHAIRLGTISSENESVEKNKIKYALTDMLRELEENAETNPNLLKEVEKYLAKKDKKGGNSVSIKGDHNINIQGVSNSSININPNPPKKD